MRLEGHDHASIALELGVTVAEAAELAKIGLVVDQSQEAEDLRNESEARLQDVLRKAHTDLKMATSQSQRTSLMRLIVQTEMARARLLGLEYKEPKTGREHA